MMLSADDLKEALQDAVKGAEKCGRFCASGARIEGGAYHVHHNGTGNRDTDVQPIYAPGMLNLSKDGLTEELRAWIADLHSGNKIDLNATMAVDIAPPDVTAVLTAMHRIERAAMAAGEPVTTGNPYLVGERGPEFWTTCYRLDHLHLHKEGSCSLVAS